MIPDEIAAEATFNVIRTELRRLQEDRQALVTENKRLVAEVERLRKALHIAAGCLDNASHRMAEAEPYRNAAVFADWAKEARAALAEPEAK